MNVVKRGDPEWNRFGLKKDRSYVVELCQQPDGRRHTRYRDIEAADHDPHCVFETEPAPGRRLIEWGFYTCSQHLKLTTGERFGFDAHGIWMTESEVAYMRRRVRGELTLGEPVPWVNGIPARRPPK